MRSHWSTPVYQRLSLWLVAGTLPIVARCVKFSTGEVQWVDPDELGRVLRWGDHLL